MPRILGNLKSLLVSVGLSTIVAFSTFSRLPMPYVAWEYNSLRYMLCALPLVGGVIATLNILAIHILEYLGASAILIGAASTVLPIALTGAIHADGFMDTSDAMSSLGDRAKRLAILSDSHVGAKAVIRWSLYLVIDFALWHEMALMEGVKWCSILAIEVAPRAMCAIAIVTYPMARDSGLLWTFYRASSRLSVIASGVVYIVALIVCAFIEGEWLIVACILGAIVILYIRLYWYSKRHFGGLTGDIAGYFIQMASLVGLAILVIGGMYGLHYRRSL